jgi:hypothetical protein
MGFGGHNRPHSTGNLLSVDVLSKTVLLPVERSFVKTGLLGIVPLWTETPPSIPSRSMTTPERCGLSRRSFGFSEWCTRAGRQVNAQPLHPKLKCGALDSETSSRPARSPNNAV